MERLKAIPLHKKLAHSFGAVAICGAMVSGCDFNKPIPPPGPTGYSQSEIKCDRPKEDPLDRGHPGSSAVVFEADCTIIDPDGSQEKVKKIDVRPYNRKTNNFGVYKNTELILLESQDALEIVHTSSQCDVVISYSRDTQETQVTETCG